MNIVFIYQFVTWLRYFMINYKSCSANTNRTYKNYYSE